MKTGLKNDIFWSEIGSRFGEPGGTPPPTTLFDDMQVILFLLGIREQDSVRLSTNKHFHGL